MFEQLQDDRDNLVEKKGAVEQELEGLREKVGKLSVNYSEMQQVQSNKDEAGAILEGLKEQLSTQLEEKQSELESLRAEVAESNERATAFEE